MPRYAGNLIQWVVMRVQNRSFVREYKSRSIGSSKKLERKSFYQEGSPEKDSFIHMHSAGAGPGDGSRPIYKEAERIFANSSVAPAPEGDQTPRSNQSAPARRILPCLSPMNDIGPAPVKRQGRWRRGSSNKPLPAESKPRSATSSHRALAQADFALNLRGDPVSKEFAELSDFEILSLIERAKQELDGRQNAGREKLKEEIKAKLANSGLNIGDLFPDLVGKVRRKSVKDADKAQGAPVPVKYRDPVSQDGWSGRGARPPHWVKRILEERGWSLEDFKKSGAYEA